MDGTCVVMRGLSCFFMLFRQWASLLRPARTIAFAATGLCATVLWRNPPSPPALSHIKPSTGTPNLFWRLRFLVLLEDHFWNELTQLTVFRTGSGARRLCKHGANIIDTGFEFKDSSSRRPKRMFLDHRMLQLWWRWNLTSWKAGSFWDPKCETSAEKEQTSQCTRSDKLRNYRSD